MGLTAMDKGQVPESFPPGRTVLWLRKAAQVRLKPGMHQHRPFANARFGIKEGIPERLLAPAPGSGRPDPVITGDGRRAGANHTSGHPA